MGSLPFGVVALGCVIIFGLAGYAGVLLAKLRHQTKTKEIATQEAITERNLKIIESVDVIAKATLQQQCDLSEAAIRLYMIMIHLQGNKHILFSMRFPALFELYEVVKDMPRAQKRASSLKKERMRFDLTRIKAETRLQSSIYGELEEILVFTGAKIGKAHTLAS